MQGQYRFKKCLNGNGQAIFLPSQTGLAAFSAGIFIYKADTAA